MVSLTYLHICHTVYTEQVYLGIYVHKCAYMHITTINVRRCHVFESGQEVVYGRV